MPCTGRFAEAWEFAAFWCIAGVLERVDDSGLPPAHPLLHDSQANFLQAGVRPNEGMMAWNLTQNTSGPITAVTANTIAAAGVAWDDGDNYRVSLLTSMEAATAELYLDIAASDIHAAMAASGACDCNLASWAFSFLAKLNIIEAAVMYNCPCGQPKFSDEAKRMWLDWASTQLEAIRDGRIELCAGATGSEFPAIGWAEQGVTEFAQVKILANEMQRD